MYLVVQQVIKEFTMKKFLLLAGVACLFSANAEAGMSQYVSGKLSYDFNKVKLKEADLQDWMEKRVGAIRDWNWGD